MSPPTQAVPSTPPAGRYGALDGLRGVAAVVVLLHHAILVIPPPEAGVEHSFWDRVLLVGSALWPGSQSVFLFFVLSGLVLAASPLRRRPFNWGAYYPSRMVRLYLPVIAAVLFAACTVLLVPRRLVAGQSVWIAAHVEPLSVGAMGRDAFMLAGVNNLNTPLWSLQWEVLFSLLLPVAVVLTVWCARRPVLGLVGLLVVSAIGLEADVKFSGLLAATVLGAVGYLPMFVVGCLIAAKSASLTKVAIRLQESRSGRALIVSLVVVALIGLSSPWTIFHVPGAVDRLLSSVTVASAALLVVATMTVPAIAKVLSSRLTRWLGRISFSLYLVHEPVLVSLGMLFPPSMAWAAVAIGIPVSFLLAIVFFRLVEGPSHNLSHAIAMRIRGARPRRVSEIADPAV